MASLRSTIIANILMVVIGLVAGQSTVEHCYKVSEYKERCFKATSTVSTKTWPKARKWCNNQTGGYTLATLRDSAAQEALVSFLMDNELTSYGVWIGARQATNSNWTWIDGSIEPDENVGGPTSLSNNSIVVLSGSSFMAASLTYRYRYICHFEDENCNKFVNESRYRKGPNNDCYVAFRRSNQVWYQARRTCWYFGGDLARSRAVLNVTSSSWPGHGKFSVGLQRDGYVWIDTEEAVGPYNNFKDGQPRWSVSRECAAIEYGNTGLWYSTECAQYPQLFVCSKVKSTTSSTLPSDKTTTAATAAADNQFQLPTVSLAAMVGIAVGAFIFFVVCIIITAVITCACVRGSSGKTSRERSRPNDYSEKQKKTAEKRSQKKKKAEDQGDHELDEQNHIDYQFGETEASVHDDRQYNAHDSQFYPDDNVFYQSDDIYTNDPQFQPSIM